MIYSITGQIMKKDRTYAVFLCQGIGFKILMSARTITALPVLGKEMTCFCSLRVKDESFDLFGFLDESVLHFFELLTTVNGVGPRTALAILDIDSLERITAAILEKRTDLLLRAPGIGKKTAERIILELQSKLSLPNASDVAEHMSLEVEVEEALVGLGYARHEARAAAESTKDLEGNFEVHVRSALKYIGSKKNKNK